MSGKTGRSSAFCEGRICVLLNQDSVIAAFTGQRLVDSGHRECYGFPMREKNETIKKWLNINVILIAVNILVWLVMCAKGDTRSAQFMYEHGAMYPPDVLDGDWYRLIRAMFLPFGAEHLISNIIMQ